MSFRFLVFLYLLMMSTESIAKPSTEKHLNLVFAGNMPDIGSQKHPSYPHLAGILEKLRAQKKPTIFAFAGGSLGPSPLSSLDKGSHIIDILNTLEPDLMTLTKRELSYFEDELTLRSYEAAFPIVSSNLYDPLIESNLEGILSSIIIEKDSSKIGFISILDEKVVEEYLLKRITVFEPRQIIEQKIKQLRQQGAELVVLVYAKELDYYPSLISENQIDFALRIMPTDARARVQKHGKKVYSISTKEPITQLRITWQTNDKAKKISVTTPKKFDDYLSTKSTTSLLIAEYNQRLNRLLNQQIGFLGEALNTSRNLVRTMEMPFGNFIADALKRYAKSEIGLINAGVIRGDKIYPKGAIITRRDIATELPFRNHVTVLSVTGEQLKQALENSVSEIEFAEGRFLQISGISFTYSLLKPVGARIQTIAINGKPLNREQIYSVATSNYLAKGGDGYAMFLRARDKYKNLQKSPVISDIVIRYIQQQKTINPKVELRIQRVDQ